MLTDRQKNALLITAAILLAACCIAILLLSHALSLEKEKNEKLPSASPVMPSTTPESALALVPETTDEQEQNDPLFTFAVMGGSANKATEDGPVNEEALRSALEALKKRSEISFAIVLGDMAAGSVNGETADENLEKWMDIATEYFPEEFYYPCFGLQESAHKGRNKIWKAEDDRSDPGNVEKVEKNYKLTVFSKVFDEFQSDGFCHEAYERTSYYFRRENCNLIILNTKWYDQMDRVSKTARDWMTETAGDDAAFNFVFMYGTPFPTVSLGMEMDADYSTTTDDDGETTNRAYRDEFWSAVDGLPGVAVFCGSEQLYARKTIDTRYGSFSNGVYQISAAGLEGSFDIAVNDPISPDSGPFRCEFYLIGEVYEDRVEFSAVSCRDGAVLDSFIVNPN